MLRVTPMESVVMPVTSSFSPSAHCVLSVSEEVSELAGVDKVDVDLASGRLTVVGSGYSDDQVKAAVEEAGYEAVAA